MAHADVDELLQVAVRADDAQCAVPGVRQLPGTFHDVAQHHGQAQLLDHRGVRPQESAQATLRRQHIVRPIGQLVDQPLQRQPRHIGK